LRSGLRFPPPGKADARNERLDRNAVVGIGRSPMSCNVRELPKAKPSSRGFQGFRGVEERKLIHGPAG